MSAERWGDFAAGMRRARLRAGVSQDDLSAETGLSQSAISLLENGHRKPRLTTLTAICRALKTTPDQILGRRLREGDYADVYPYPMDEGSTHWVGCWRERRHHNCAVAEVERLRAALEKGLLVSSAYEGAPCFAELLGEVDDESPCECPVCGHRAAARIARTALEGNEDRGESRE